MRTILDLVYDERHGDKGMLDLYLPEADAFPLFLYFHGGGIENGSRKNGERLAKYLTDHGIGFASASYRLYPDARYPDFIEDAARAAAWCKTHMGEYGGTKLFLGGSSAGGYLSMMLCFDPKYLGLYDISPLDIAGYVHDSGQPTCHFNVLRERGLDTRRVIIDESAPLYHVGLAKEYAPMLVLYADRDMTNRPEQTEVMLTALRHFGYDMDKVEAKKLHGTHCFTSKTTDENGNNMLAVLVGDFIGKWM